MIDWTDWRWMALIAVMILWMLYWGCRVGKQILAALTDYDSDGVPIGVEHEPDSLNGVKFHVRIFISNDGSRKLSIKEDTSAPTKHIPFTITPDHVIVHYVFDDPKELTAFLKGVREQAEKHDVPLD